MDVPDTMKVHGIYDTSATLMTFESREEYQKQLQQEAGVFGFSAGVKEAWGGGGGGGGGGVYSLFTSKVYGSDGCGC